jgi:hypothetical protein
MPHPTDEKGDLLWDTSHLKSPSAEMDFILMANASLI